MSSSLLNRVVTALAFAAPIGVFFVVAQVADREYYVKVEEIATTTPEAIIAISFSNGKPDSSAFLNASSSLTYDEMRQPLIEIREDVRIGYLDFSEASALKGDDPYFPFIISDAKMKSDVLVLYAGGTLQKDMARSAIDAGADIVVGSFPRLEAMVEQYEGGIIFSYPSGTSDQDLKLEVIATKKGIQSFATSTEDF